MSEESRLGAEAIETACAIKPLVQAGLRVFFYLQHRDRTLASPTDKILLSLTAFADGLEREKARQRTYDAMLRQIVSGRIQFTLAERDGQKGYSFRREVALSTLLAGTVDCATTMASPIYASWNQLDLWIRAVDGLRRAA